MDMNRRRFLEGGLALGAGMALSPVAGILAPFARGVDNSKTTATQVPKPRHARYLFGKKESP